MGTYTGTDMVTTTDTDMETATETGTVRDTHSYAATDTVMDTKMDTNSAKDMYTNTLTNTDTATVECTAMEINMDKITGGLGGFYPWSSGQFHLEKSQNRDGGWFWTISS